MHYMERSCRYIFSLTLRFFRSPGSLEMRKAKIKSNLHVEHLPNVKHYAHVRYEDFLEKAEKNLGDLLGRFAIATRKGYQGVFYSVRGENFKGRGKKKYIDQIGTVFKKYQYYTEEHFLEKIDAKLMDKLVSALDPALESKLGYEVRDVRCASR